MKRPTKYSRILTALAEGPATCSELVAITGMSMKHCSAYLLTAHQRGLVSRKPAPGLAHERAFGKSSAPFLYTLITLATVAPRTTQPTKEPLCP